MSEMEPAIDVRIVEGPVSHGAPDRHPATAGGECVFLGRTRRDVHESHGPLVRLSYEAYRPLAERTLRELAAEAQERFGCLSVRVHHAVGDVPVGEASVLVQVLCPHRDEAFKACRFLIDRLKATVPIWEREEWSDGTTWARGVPVSVER
ncbi:MAG: molybdenum cofactor biosynthesis protein MoaE [Planctomycetota bacterium]|jgi:molybdopterin synthase catalytic subunit